jgi:uncharacterized protein YbbC (DUF1343 family)
MRVLEQIDMLVFDIQDVGSRYYTYLNTLAMLMERLQGTGIELLVLDRPNPLGGERVEGPALSSDYTSFVGVLPVPVRHGLTAGELALLYKDLKSLDVLLTVLPLENWERKYHFDQTGLPWVPPSPNMPTLHTAMVYPGMCLLEGTNLSEGRGTTTPFELCGAPGIDPDLWCRRLQEYNLPGIKFRPVYFKPTFHKYAGTTCGGVCLHVVERNSFQPFRSGLALIATCMELFPGYEFLHDVYEFESRYPAFDYLAGSGAIREMLQAGTPITDIVTSWQNYQKEFLVMKKEYHLYT